uniref:Shootin 2 n=1 Tax=Nothobranchius furzeri TaxID=105023 RepID=A0A8C6PTR1_NOTFU
AFRLASAEGSLEDASPRTMVQDHASNQLLKEIGVLEMQFQIERSCRESAEALAFQVSKENNILKRKSRMLMPRMPDIPEDLISENLDVEADLTVDGDVVDSGGCSTDDTLLLETQAKITVSDSLITVFHQLAVEVEEKEAILRKMSKQSKTMNKIKRVSKLVTEEFTEMSQKLELEQDLRQHAEVVAHQVCVFSGLCKNIFCHTFTPVDAEGDRSGMMSADLSELQNLREQQEKTEEERKSLEKQLFQANTSITQLREEGSRNSTKEPPNCERCTKTPKYESPSSDIKAKAVDEMMERIKKGIILRPIKNIQGIFSKYQIVLQDQRSENRKSVILELKGVLDNIKRQPHRRLPSRRGNIRDAELLMVLQRRRRVIGDTQDTWSSNLPPASPCSDGPWAGESGTAPVLRRLKQNREQRDSRIRASALIISHGDLKHTQEQIPNIST